MKASNLLYLSTFLFSYVFAQNETEPVFDPNADNYPNKALIDSGKNFGFTIEYHNYYKVLKNDMTKRSYCLVGWDQPKPEGCDSITTFKTPVTAFSIEKGFDAIIPFTELLGIQHLIVKTDTSLSTSPCIGKSIASGSTDSPVITFSSTTEGTSNVDFSADSLTLEPLQKAAWLMYLGAFFDLEVVGLDVFNQLTTTYNCHKTNIATASRRIEVSWTTFNPDSKIYTVHDESYYRHLVADAGGLLIYPNSAQSHIFNPTDAREAYSLTLALHASEYIVDSSATDVTYSMWVGNNSYFKSNSGLNVSAVIRNKVYSTNGLVGSNNIPDWSQRSIARPDLALLEIIKLIYPTYQTDSKFPVWLRPFSTLEPTVMTESIYGGCGNYVVAALTQSHCQPGLNTPPTVKKPLTVQSKAGISVGTIVFVIIAAAIGIWAFRKYQRNRRRHNFYRMNDL